jgi:hypothetical protein
VPFTPFHMGAACVVKAVAGRRFSLMIFGFSQIAMDIEPLVHLLRGEGVIHGFSHTALGATLIGVIAVAAGRPLCQLLLRIWKPDPKDHFLDWLHGPSVIGWWVVIATAFIGTYSHVAFDSLVSFDVKPFGPFTDWNPLLGSISMGALCVVLVGMGILGAIGMAIVYMVETSSDNQM